MPNLFALFHGEYSDRSLLGIYSSAANAEAERNRLLRGAQAQRAKNGFGGYSFREPSDYDIECIELDARAWDSWSKSPYFKDTK